MVRLMVNRDKEYVWGAPVTRKLYPTESGNPKALPAQSITAYLFLDRPSITDGASGNGAIDVSSFVSQNMATPYDLVYSYGAQQDPNPGDYPGEEVYWESVNYKLVDGGPTNTLLRSIKFARLGQHDSIPDTTAADIADIMPNINSYLTDAQINDFIEIAQQDVKDRLRAEGFKWQRIYDLHLLRWAIAYRAIAECAISQMKVERDRHHIRNMYFNEKYEDKIKAIILQYDPGAEGDPVLEISTEQNYVVMRR